MKKRTIRNEVASETTIVDHKDKDAKGLNKKQDAQCVQLEYIDTDMRSYQESFMENDICGFDSLQSLELVNCNLDLFEPKILPKTLEILSLQDNKI